MANRSLPSPRAAEAPVPKLTIDREAYPPAYLSLIANALSWGGSRLYLREFGVGTNEWRILSGLTDEPGATANRLCQLLGLNKSVASRAIRVLEGKALLSIASTDGHRCLWLTRDGVSMHDRVIAVARARNDLLLAGFSAGEVAQLMDFLRRMHGNLPAMNAYDPFQGG